MTNKTQGINLINPGGWYSMVVDRFICSIAPHVGDEWARLPAPVSNRFNVHFFRELGTQLKTRRQFCDMYIAHGWFQKMFSTYLTQILQFQYVGVPGPMVRDFLLARGVKPEKLITVGHPGMDSVINGQERNPIVSDKPIIVAAFSHSDFRDAWDNRREELLGNLAEDFHVETVIHPAYGYQLSRDIIQGAAVVLSDISGTILEAWTFGVPVVFPAWGVCDRFLRDAGGTPLGRVYEESIGYHVHDRAKWESTIRQAAEEGITQAEIDYVNAYFPIELRGHSGEAAARGILAAYEAGGRWSE